MTSVAEVIRASTSSWTGADPSFSPDGRRIVFSGMKHGMSDLYVASLDAPGYQQLTKDQHGDLQPQWSPDGKTIAFASDRGEDTDFEILKIGKWKLSLYDTEKGTVTVLPGQASGTINSNPQWAPDGKSLAYPPPPDRERCLYDPRA